MKNQDDDKLAIYASGILTGIILTGLSATLFDMEDYILRYQTLIAGVLAIFSALIGAYAIFKQTNIKKRTNHLLAKSTLALSLSDIQRYIARVFWILQDTTVGLNDKSTPNVKFPSVHQNTISSLQFSSAHLDKTKTEEILLAVNWYQIQNARLEWFLEKFQNPTFRIQESHKKDALRDIAKLRLIINKLYDPARQDLDLTGDYCEQVLDQEVGNMELFVSRPLNTIEINKKHTSN